MKDLDKFDATKDELNIKAAQENSNSYESSWIETEDGKIYTAKDWKRDEFILTVQQNSCSEYNIKVNQLMNYKVNMNNFRAWGQRSKDNNKTNTI